MRVPQHLVDARRERLRDLIRQDGFLPLAEVCRVLDISEATARRDLEAIAAAGHITRTYGGALADYNSSFASIHERGRQARGSKAAIARNALRHVPKSGTVYLDAGTTVLALARLLARHRGQNLAIVTNSVALASVLGGAPGVTLHLLGGVFLHRQATLFGDPAVAALARWQIDAAFLGAEAMNAEGIWNSHPQVIELQQAVLKHSKDSYFLLDATKLDCATPHLVTLWKEVRHLVTDAPVTTLQAAGIPLPRERVLVA
jgi:DeoR/GlpR family transcriptional regulator of sugar metabolism